MCSRYTHIIVDRARLSYLIPLIPPNLYFMSRQVPPSYPSRHSGPPERDPYTRRPEYRTDQNASTSEAFSNQYRPLTAKLKSLGVRSDSVLYHIAERIEETIGKLDVWSTNLGRRRGGRYMGGQGDGQSYTYGRETGNWGGCKRQQGGRRSQDRASSRDRQKGPLRIGHEGEVQGGYSEPPSGRNQSSRRRVTAVKTYVSDPESRDISNDSDAALFRRKMGIDTPSHSLSPSAQSSIKRHPGVGPTSVDGLVRDGTRPETSSVLRRTPVDPNGASSTAARQPRKQTTSPQREQGQDRHETRGTANDAQLARRRRRKTRDGRREHLHTSVSPLLYGKYF